MLASVIVAEDAYSEPHISENNFKCYCVVGPSGCSDYRNSDGSVVVQTVRLYLWIDVSSIYAGELNTLAVFQCFMFLKFCALTYWPLEQLGVECLAQGHLDSSWWGGGVSSNSHSPSTFTQLGQRFAPFL